MIPFTRAVASGQWKRVVAVTSAQAGKTDNVLDIIGQRLDQRPAPILYVGPTKQFVTEQFEPRVMSLLDEAPVLRLKVSRGKRMTKTRKVVAGVPLRLAHGGSSTALKSDPAALALVDEYDEMVRSVKNQGDPLNLVEHRGDTYADFVVAVTSTPSVGAVDVVRDPETELEFWGTVQGDELESPIWRLWQEGTRFHWAWRCPHCQDWFIPRFRNLKWLPENGATPAEAKRTAYIECPRCEGHIDEHHKAALNETGVFVAPGQRIDEHGTVHGDPPESSTWSSWTSGLASPFVTFGQRAEAFLKAVRAGDLQKVQVEITAGFGEMWAGGGGEAPEAHEVLRLALPYSHGDIPAGVVVLTAAIDVQKNRLVYVIRGWGARATSWLINHGELWGPTADHEVWNDLADLLETPIGGKRIRLALIDSGFRPNKKDAGPEHVVYEFCRRHQRFAKPAKGYGSLRAPVLVSRIEVQTPRGGAAKYGLDLVRVNTDWAKLWVHERIRWPQDQPGAFYISQDTTEDYALQLVSESRIKKPSGQPQWIQRSRNNHYLDCEAMNYVAGHLLNVQRIRPADGQEVRSSPRQAEPADEAVTTPETRPPTPPPQSRPRTRFAFRV